MCENFYSQDQDGQADRREDGTTETGIECYEMQVAVLVSVWLTSALELGGSVLMP